MPRPDPEDIIHYFTLMSSELHYLDIILKMELFTLMFSEFGQTCLYFVILPVYLWVCPSFCYLVRVRASVSSCSCWFMHFCHQNGASCIYAFFLKQNLESFLSACLSNTRTFAENWRKFRQYFWQFVHYFIKLKFT